jgi:hypothetical protein
VKLQGSIALVFCLLVTTISSIQASESADFKSAPSNFESLKNTLSESLAIVNCGSDYGVGFAGNWNLSQEQKNQGINTLFFTSKTLVDKCQGSYRSLIPGGKVRYKSTDYDIKKWGWNLDGTDFANVASSVNVPTLDLYSSIFPEVGWWVVVAYYVPGFGIAFKESKIQLVEKEQFVLGIDSFTPVPLVDGVLFDNKGSFLGIVTRLGNPIPSGLLKVHGAPRQCNVSGVSGATITNCPISREKVWNSISPSITPSPGPSPSKSAVDASLEVRDAYASTLDAYKLYTGKVVSCLEAFKGRNASERKLLSIVSGSQICTSENSTAKSANDRTLSLGQTISSSRDPLGLITQFNNLTDTFNLSTIAINDAILMAKKLAALYPDFESLENSLLVYNDQFDSLDYIFDNLPLKVTSLIKQGIAFDYVEEYRELVADAESQFDAAQGEIDGVTYPDPEAIDNFGDTLKVILRGLPSETTFNRTLERAMSAIPASYCKKGSSVALPKKGKCATGFARVKIDKG